MRGEDVTRSGIACPVCGVQATGVIDSRPLHRATKIRRRRHCTACDHRFTTYEAIMPEPEPYRSVARAQRPEDV